MRGFGSEAMNKPIITARLLALLEYSCMLLGISGVDLATSRIDLTLRSQNLANLLMILFVILRGTGLKLGQTFMLV
jgi:hypothetical protein